ncbi:MAG: hypothetical protein MJ182_04255 [Treponema sp.]|nr:hypothetical protein [Treponema sp.]
MKTLFKSLLTIFTIMFLFSCGSTPKLQEETQFSEIKETENIQEKQIIFLCTNDSVSELSSKTPFVLDDFEDGNYWYGVGDSWDQWGSHNLSIAAGVVKDWASTGSHCLKAIMEPAGPETSKQATWCCNSLIENNLSGFKWVEVTVNNPQDFDFELNIAIQDGKNYSWMQSKTLLVKPGISTCLFDISEMPDEFLENVFCFMIQSLNENPGGFLYFDDFKLYE